MNHQQEGFRIRIESYKGNDKAPLTVGTLGLALTVSNRILNSLSYPDQQRFPRYNPATQEPPFADLIVTDLRNGSALVDGFIQTAEHPFVQNVADSIIGAILYEHGLPTIRTISKQLRRLASVEGGKTLVIRIRLGSAAFEVVSTYQQGGMRQKVSVIPHDDVQ